MKKAVCMLGLVLLPVLACAQYWGPNPLLDKTPAAKAAKQDEMKRVPSQKVRGEKFYGEKVNSSYPEIDERVLSDLFRVAAVGHAQQREKQERALNIVKAAAPEAEYIFNLGVIGLESNGQDIALNDDKYYSSVRSSIHYVCAFEKGKRFYYGVQVRDEQTDKLTKADKILFKNTASENLAVKDLFEERLHINYLGARFARLVGTDKVKKQLSAIAAQYPLSVIEDFVDYKVLSGGETASSSVQAVLGIKLAGGEVKSMKLRIDPAHGTPYYWVNEYSVYEIK